MSYFHKLLSMMGSLAGCIAAPFKASEPLRVVDKKGLEALWAGCGFESQRCSPLFALLACGS